MPQPQGMERGHNNVDKHKAIIVSGFAAIGKTSFSRNAEVRRITELDVVDLDSSLYSKKPGYPDYLNAIRKAAEKPCIILISTHDGLPTQLAKEGHYVALVYPGGGMDAKMEWLSRLEKREKLGKRSTLYMATDKNWNLWFERTTKEVVTSKWTLSNDEYLSNVFGSIYDDFRKQRLRK
ncbi:hypothetical protein VMCG_03903 [Cytospora schulzeri]|uniref:Zeta toxin domain-containing protein n=1 Tax=Cytospora schulzeri TaxID=448051 RepID=A0A423WV01_9PEZI|nr:hypothetical protein VMCG_03903 [Valsa malicola]